MSCCSKALCDSLYRSYTYSFGAICAGSLLVAVVQVLQFLVQVARNQNRDRRNNAAGAFCLCLLECLITYLEKAIEYVNKWAFGKSI